MHGLGDVKTTVSPHPPLACLTMIGHQAYFYA